MITINGVAFAFEENISLERFVEKALSSGQLIPYQNRVFVYMKNGAFSPSQSAGETALEDGDEIKLLALSSGG